MRKVTLMTVLLMAITLFGQNKSNRTAEYNLENKVAIQGFDPVAYFKQNRAIKGKNIFTTSYQGVIYKFSTTANKDAFVKSPSAYEPEFGGWCAYAMGSTGEKVEINPETFKIIDGKLYLFYNAFFNNTLKSWNKDEQSLKVKAENNWKKVIK